MADFGLTEEELQDAMNLEKVFGWKKSNDKCCRCGNSGTTHIDPKKYMFSCSNCATTHGGTRIGNESIGSYEMQQLESNYGNKSKKNPTPPPPPRKSVTPKTTPQKSKKPTRRRSPSPSESESEEERPRRPAKSPPVTKGKNRRGSDVQFEDAFNAAAIMDKQVPGMLGLNQNSQQSAGFSHFGAQPSGGFDAFGSQHPNSFDSQQNMMQLMNPNQFNTQQQQQQNNFNQIMPYNSNNNLLSPAPAFFSGPPGSSNFHNVQQPYFMSNPLAPYGNQPQVVPPSSYAANLHQQKISSLLQNPSAKASNPFLPKLLPPTVLPQPSPVFLPKVSDPVAYGLLLQQHQAQLSNQMYNNAFRSEPTSAGGLVIDPATILAVQQHLAQQQQSQQQQAISAPVEKSSSSDWFL